MSVNAMSDAWWYDAGSGMGRARAIFDSVCGGWGTVQPMLRRHSELTSYREKSSIRTADPQCSFGRENCCDDVEWQQFQNSAEFRDGMSVQKVEVMTSGMSLAGAMRK